MFRCKIAILIACIGVFFSQGCSNEEAKLRNDLKAFGLTYISYYDANQVGPPNWDELVAFAKEYNLYPEAIERVRDAGYEVTWNVKLNELEASSAETVMAKPPGAGPQVMMDGSVK